MTFVAKLYFMYIQYIHTKSPQSNKMLQLLVTYAHFLRRKTFFFKAKTFIHIFMSDITTSSSSYSSSYVLYTYATGAQRWLFLSPPPLENQPGRGELKGWIRRISKFACNHQIDNTYVREVWVGNGIWASWRCFDKERKASGACVIGWWGQIYI